MDIKAGLKNLKIDLTRIEDEHLRGCIILLLNAVEQLSRENHELRQANQALKDDGTDQPSNPKKPKKEQITVDRIERCYIPADTLPIDAPIKEEFLRELGSLGDVANNRPRDTMAKIIIDPGMRGH